MPAPRDPEQSPRSPCKANRYFPAGIPADIANRIWRVFDDLDPSLLRNLKKPSIDDLIERAVQDAWAGDLQERMGKHAVEMIAVWDVICLKRLRSSR